MQPVPGVQQLIGECDGIPFNVYLLRHDGHSWLIDAGLAHTPAEIIFPALQTEAGRPSTVELLAVTHAHADHCGGTAALAQRVPALKVAALPETARWLADPAGSVEHFYAALPGEWPLSPTERAQIEQWQGRAHGAAVVLSDGQEFGGPAGLRVVATPGHCPGHAAYYWPARRLLLSGDALQGNGIRVGGALTYLPVYDDVDAYVKSLLRLAGCDVEWVLPGHGAPLGAEELHCLVQESLDTCAAIDETVRWLQRTKPGLSLRALTAAVCAELGYAAADVTGGLTIRAHLAAAGQCPHGKRGE